MVAEGPATEPHRWPDGMEVSIAKVERVPNDWGVDVDPGNVIVRITVRVHNGGSDVPFVPGSKTATVLYGPSRVEAGQVTSYSYDDPKEQRAKSLDSEDPSLLPAGKTVTMWESGLVPVKQLHALVVVIDLPAEEGLREPWTFTGAQELLKTVD